MGYSLAKENSVFVKRMLKLGRFNNQSEVIREALRRMERQEKAYLNPQPLSDEDAERIYAPDPARDKAEATMGRKVTTSLRRMIKQHKLELGDL
jgi:putative addiction module CopG family antidote